MTDGEWAIIQPLLPNNPRGVPRLDDRRVINGILWRFRTAALWRDVPDRYRPRSTHNRIVRSREAGVWDRILEAVSAVYKGRLVMIDSSCMRVHQHGAAAKMRDADGGGMGRSRGRLTTKIHTLVDAAGRPVPLILTPGQAGDAPVGHDLMKDLAPCATLIADRAYDTEAIREMAEARSARANIPPRVTRKNTFTFSAWVYRQRNRIERYFNRMKQFRGLATRCDRRPENYLAARKIAAIRIWLADQ